MIHRLLLVLAVLMGVSMASLRAADGARIVFMIGEEEYHTWETSPRKT